MLCLKISPPPSAPPSQTGLPEGDVLVFHFPIAADCQRQARRKMGEKDLLGFFQQIGVHPRSHTPGLDEKTQPGHIPSITTSAPSRHTSPGTCLEVFFL